jgi:hypothetical protein
VKKWEYYFYVMSVPPDKNAVEKNQSAFDIMGQEGWELVQVINDRFQPVAIMKRERAS